MRIEMSRVMSPFMSGAMSMAMSLAISIAITADFSKIRSHWYQSICFGILEVFLSSSRHVKHVTPLMHKACSISNTSGQMSDTTHAQVMLSMSFHPCHTSHVKHVTFMSNISHSCQTCHVTRFMSYITRFMSYITRFMSYMSHSCQTCHVTRFMSNISHSFHIHVTHLTQPPCILAHIFIGKRWIWKGEFPHLVLNAEIMGGGVKFN